ncbi:MAG: energy transducer TonB [Sphingobacteriales bacterium]|nr:energy transducer TonB [Sphingobacteriales bacterium]
MTKIICLLLLLSVSTISIASGNAVDTTKPIFRNSQQSKDSNVLVVVDGKVIGTIKEIKPIDSLVSADAISSINVLKGSQATDKYGEKGKDGVIEIFLKENMKEVTIADPELKDVSDDDNITFDKVEVEASFPGGAQAWRNFLERTLNANVPVENSAPAGAYTVVIQFVVDKNGNISDIKPLTNHGHGMEKEVIRVIMKSPKWVPAMQNGRVVKAYRKQPVTFMITEEGPRKKNKKND